MKIIGVEEHIMLDGNEQIEKRLKDMDEAGVDMQVLSCVVPNDSKLDPSEAITKARYMNEKLASIIREYPERFSAFAAGALQNPEETAVELERAVTELGLKGMMLLSNINGEYFDNPKFQAVLEKAEELQVPIYLHPCPPSPDMIKPFLTYPVLSGSMWAYSVEAGLHAMRLICGGIFDRFPVLQIILGHMGEGIPYWLWRIDNRWQKEKDGVRYDPVASKLKKKPSQYFKDNFYLSTSGMFWPPVLQFVNSVLGPDRILFGVDYNQESNKIAVQFIEETPISYDDKEKICHLNAERLLRL